ncbi:MAG: rhodanese-like domain-containing protein [Ilumatobacteraceae bacterium]|jgi:rhodanese-related sulfurtransferase|nr:rhodanese-like domain-containing protein [Ilumatobacteraceae bacterium]
MTYQEIDVDELARRLAAGGTVFDVREQAEFDEAHIEGAVLVPLGQVPDALDHFAGVAPVHVICRSGNRSGQACRFLGEHGVEAVNVEGGMLAWMLAGHPVAASA